MSFFTPKNNYWSSEWLFVLAAVGSAAGLGNVWRFPYLAYENGGAVFFVAYLVCLALIGFPILISELGIGQSTGKSAPEAMASVTKNNIFRFIGWMGVLSGAVVVSYYTVVMAWSANYLKFAPTLAWGEDTKNFFFNDFLQLSDGVETIGGFVPALVIATALIYVVLYFTLWKGVDSISIVAKFITPLPFILVTILAINALSLDGSIEGLRFIFVPEWSKLGDLSIWIAAASQVFFTLTLGFGTMFAYGALLKKDVDLVKTTAAVIIGDTFMSIIASTAIFGTLGYMASNQGVELTEVVASGVGLAFIVFPAALNLLPLAPDVFASFFFFSLFALALTSNLSLMQAVIGAIQDRWPCWRRHVTVAVIAILFFVASLFYTRANGLYLLDIVDHFVVNYALVAVGLLEMLAIGWWYNADKLRNALNEQAKIKLGNIFPWTLKIIVPLTLTYLIYNAASADLSANYESYPTESLLAYGVGTLVLIVLGGIALAKLVKECRL